MGKCKKVLSNRRHNLQLTRELVQNCESHHYFLMNRTATFWNNLPVKIVNAKSVNCSNHALDKHLEHINWKTHTIPHLSLLHQSGTQKEKQILTL